MSEDDQIAGAFLEGQRKVTREEEVVVGEKQNETNT